jgi:hypothetical protein
MDRGRCFLREKGCWYYQKYPMLVVSIGVGNIGLVIFVSWMFAHWLATGAPFHVLGHLLGFTGCIAGAFLLILFCGTLPDLCRARFRIYENGFTPHYVPLKYCLKTNELPHAKACGISSCLAGKVKQGGLSLSAINI